MGRRLARSAQIGGPDSIAQRFQVKTYSGEPFTSKRACNLLSKDRWRMALGDEASPLGPEMALVGFTFAAARLRERLAGAGTGPDRPIGGPPSELKGKRPSADTSKEVAGRCTVGGAEVLDRLLIYVPQRQMAFSYKVV